MSQSEFLKFMLFVLASEIIGFYVAYLWRTKIQKQRASGSSLFVIRLCKLTFPCDEIQECIIGDLLEEYNQIPSKLKAHLWLYKQVLTSFFPLVYKNIKSRFASLLREQIR